jgi:hypothetical protein
MADIRDYNKTLTPAERSESARRAAKASVEARRRYKAMRDCMKAVLLLDVDEPLVKAALAGLGLEPTRQNAIALSTIAKAGTGDIEAARFVRDTIGEKPTEQYNLAVSDKPIRAIDLSGLTDEEIEALADRADG